MKIVLIEDDTNINSIITNLLSSYDIVSCITGEEGLKHIDSSTNLVIVDLMLPGISGTEVIKQIRMYDKVVKIFVITALNIEDIQIQCLELGVNDYIKKPISLKVLSKKVEIINSTFDSLIMNHGTLEVTFRGNIYPLTKKEFEILNYLYKNSNHYVNREELSLAVWGYDFEGEYKNINTHIKNIRHKITGINIKTERNIGYRYVH